MSFYILGEKILAWENVEDFVVEHSDVCKTKSSELMNTFYRDNRNQLLPEENWKENIRKHSNTKANLTSCYPILSYRAQLCEFRYFLSKKKRNYENKSFIQNI